MMGLHRCVTCGRLILPWQRFGFRVFRHEYGWYGHSIETRYWHAIRCAP